MDKDIGSIVQKLEQDYVSGTGTLMSKYVRTDAYEDINTIYAYLNSKHISGSKDSLGRDKPFFNIVLGARNVWYRATDIDRKNIMAKATKQSDIVGAFLLSVHLQDWMRREHFGKFLNAWGLVQAGFNSAVVKFVEKEGRLIPSVVPWSRLIVDQVNFNANPKIEVLELTEDELYERYDRDKVDELIKTAKARELLNKQRKDNKNFYYKVYEVHGKFPVACLTDKESDEDRFSQQMWVLSYLKDKKTKKDDKFVLYCGEEEKDPYMLTALLPSDDGSISFDGSVKNLFEAQWMQNHSIKAIKDQLDLASKLIFQTADGNFVGQNALFAIESGDILIHELNKPLTPINNQSHDVTALQSFGGQWQTLAKEINGISDAMLGVQKSGTAWRQTEAILNESHSLFELMTENRGLDIEEMMRNFVFPYLKKKMNNSKEIVATLDMHGIKQIESKYIKNTAVKMANRQIIDQVLSGQIAEQPDLEALEQQVRGGLQEQGTQRFFKPSELDDKTWKDVLKDLVWDVEVEVTGENVDKQAVYTTLNTALQVAANPGFAQSPTAQLIVGKILTETGNISPMEWSEAQNQTQQQAREQVQTAPGGKVASEPLEELVKQEKNVRANV
jgi:hypothetical protein